MFGNAPVFSGRGHLALNKAVFCSFPAKSLAGLVKYSIHALKHLSDEFEHVIFNPVWVVFLFRP